MRVCSLLSLGFVLILGCSSGTKLAPVSGTVTLNGKPLAGASVNFEPQSSGEKKSLEAPLNSTGKTNDKGEYSLETIKGQKGAVVGKHKVYISLLKTQVGDGDARVPRGGWPTKDMVPIRYNEKSELTIDVPSGGTDKANFELKSP
jgi:hypothetical protein